MLETGIKGKLSRMVTEDMTAKKVGSGQLDVLATPMLIAMAEECAWKSVADALEDGTGTVGTKMKLSHMATTPVGMEVHCETELIHVERRRLTFSIRAYDAVEKIAVGVHERFIVANDRFLEKASAKKAKEEQIKIKKEMIWPISPDEISSIRTLIPAKMYKAVEEQKSYAIGVYDNEHMEAIGVVVFCDAPKTKALEGNEMLIQSVFVKEEFRYRGACSMLLKEAEDLARQMGGYTGMSVNIPVPERNDAVAIFGSAGYKHRADGNRIYRIPVADFSDSEVMDTFETDLKRSQVYSFSELGREDLEKLYETLDTEVPAWLHPKNYGGQLQKDFCFVCIKGEAVTGYLACTIYEKGDLYIGGIYMKKKGGLAVVALLGAFMKQMKARRDIVSVTFSAATEDGENLAKDLFEIANLKPTPIVVANYYKEL